MRILVVGGGSIGKRHIRNLKELGYRNIVCLKRVLDPKFANEYNVQVIADYSEISDKPPEVVFICTPTSMHLEGLRFAVSINAHVFMEKPLIDSHKALSDCKNILETYENVFYIGFMLRCHPLIKKIRSILSTGYLGEVYNARFEFGSYLPFWHPYEDYKISYAARRELGGGVINTITHELDLINYFFGVPERITCRALNLNLLKIDVEEQCEAIFDYRDKQVTLHLDYLQKEYDRKIQILGTDGRLSWNWHDSFLELKIFQKEAERFHEPKSYDVNQLYMDETQKFFWLIDNHKSTHSMDQKEAITNAELMLAMHDSYNSNKTVKVGT